MRSSHATRHLTSVPPTAPATPAAVRRDCRSGCGWSVVSGSLTTAEIEAATHRVAEHTTETERERVARAVMGWEEVFAEISEDLPRSLLPGIVDQALGQSAALLEVAA